MDATQSEGLCKKNQDKKQKSPTSKDAGHIMICFQQKKSTLRKVQRAQEKAHPVGGSWECGCQAVSSLTAMVTTL